MQREGRGGRGGLWALTPRRVQEGPSFQCNINKEAWAGDTQESALSTLLQTKSSGGTWHLTGVWWVQLTQGETQKELVGEEIAWDDTGGMKCGSGDPNQNQEAGRSKKWYLRNRSCSGYDGPHEPCYGALHFPAGKSKLSKFPTEGVMHSYLDFW